MPNMNDGAAPPGHPPDAAARCPFCNDKNHSGYHTKHGKLKDEDQLRDNLRVDARTTITTDPEVGSVYPQPGGGDSTSHWEAKAEVFEDDSTRIAAAPHHIIPGDAAMSKVPALEAYTTADKGGKIKEDIGYSIDCPRNGIFLPRYPDIFGTKHIQVPDGAGGTKTMEAREYYGRSWSELGDDEQRAVAYTIMLETSLQIHQTSHGAKYLSDRNKSYDREARQACQHLADLVQALRAICPDQQAEPYDPPYGLVALINAESDEIRTRITGRPRYWDSWCTRLAERLTLDLKSGLIKERIRFGISRK